MRRRAPLLCAAVLLMASCSDEEPPSDASEEKFCTVFNSLSEADTGEDFQRFATRLREVGTPAGISNDGRAGFEVVIRVASSLDSDASLEELEDPDVSGSEAQHAQEFLEYGSETCASLDEESGAL